MNNNRCLTGGSMPEIQLKVESLPQRCEICHQADCFDASTNYCSRCGKAANLLKPENEFPKPTGKITIQLKLEPSDFTQAQRSLVVKSTTRQILFWVIIIGGALFLYTIFSASSSSAPSSPTNSNQNAWRA